jgi:hypothetical protein
MIHPSGRVGAGMAARGQSRCTPAPKALLRCTPAPKALLRCTPAPQALLGTNAQRIEARSARRGQAVPKRRMPPPQRRPLLEVRVG